MISIAMDPDDLSLITLPVTAIAIFALWSVLVRRPEGVEAIRGNFDALKGREVDHNRKRFELTE